MSAFIQLTLFRTEQPAYVRADKVMAVHGVPGREAVPESNIRLFQEGRPPHTRVVLDALGDAFDGVTHPLEFRVVETVQTVMTRLFDASRS